MSTINSDRIAYMIVSNNGVYPGDPQVDEVYSYLTVEGTRVFKIIYNRRVQLAEFFSSPFCSNITRLWSKESGLEQAGKDFIKEYEANTGKP